MIYDHILCVSVSLLACTVQTSSAIWPQPNSMKAGSDFLQVDLSSFAFKVDGGISLSDFPNLKDAMAASAERVKNDNLPYLSVDRGYNWTSDVKAASVLTTVALSKSSECPSSSSFQDISDAAVLPLDERDESYNLTIPADGSYATLTACNALGMLRGITTFEQLIYVLPKSARSIASTGVAYIPHAPLTIEDTAAFPWRGLLLDTSRNFYPLSSLKKMLDVMSWSKFSEFHWHVTDSQSWPLEVGTYPNLTDAAYNTDSVYSKDDVSDLISYANAIGIDVVMEVDTPAHTASLVTAFPDIIDCYMEDWTQYAAEPEAGQLNIASQQSINVIKNIFSDVLSRESYTSSFFSPGGDELNIACYNKTHDGETFESTLKKFSEETYAVITDSKKTPYVWEDMLVTHDIGLQGSDALIAVWTSSSVAKRVADLGNRLVHAPANYFYLDCGQGSWVGNDTAPSWCDPYHSWQNIYAFDQYANLTTDQYPLVTGGQVCLWSEQSGPENLETQLWPRAAALSEVFWNKALASERDPTEAMVRMHDFRYRIVKRGIQANPIQPEFCALRPHACDL